jgi:hypothetical protein
MLTALAIAPKSLGREAAARPKPCLRLSGTPPPPRPPGSHFWGWGVAEVVGQACTRSHVRTPTTRRVATPHEALRALGERRRRSPPYKGQACRRSHVRFPTTRHVAIPHEALRALGERRRIGAKRQVRGAVGTNRRPTIVPRPYGFFRPDDIALAIVGRRSSPPSDRSARSAPSSSAAQLIWERAGARPSVAVIFASHAFVISRGAFFHGPGQGNWARFPGVIFLLSKHLGWALIDTPF